MLLSLVNLLFALVPRATSQAAGAQPLGPAFPGAYYFTTITTTVTPTVRSTETVIAATTITRTNNGLTATTTGTTSVTTTTTTSVTATTTSTSTSITTTTIATAAGFVAVQTSYPDTTYGESGGEIPPFPNTRRKVREVAGGRGGGHGGGGHGGGGHGGGGHGGGGHGGGGHGGGGHGGGGHGGGHKDGGYVYGFGPAPGPPAYPPYPPRPRFVITTVFGDPVTSTVTSTSTPVTTTYPFATTTVTSFSTSTVTDTATSTVATSTVTEPLVLATGFFAACQENNYADRTNANEVLSIADDGGFTADPQPGILSAFECCQAAFSAPGVGEGNSVTFAFSNGDVTGLGPVCTVYRDTPGDVCPVSQATNQVLIAAAAGTVYDLTVGNGPCGQNAEQT